MNTLAQLDAVEKQVSNRARDYISSTRRISNNLFFVNCYL